MMWAIALTILAWLSVIGLVLSAVWLIGYTKGRADALKAIRRYQ